MNHEGDNYRTRLTHSLEGAQIGRSVARALGLNEELTECLVLGHDLGHTPFGHSGERVMDELMRDHGGFEHNRQTLRILEVLEERYPGLPGPEPDLGGARGDHQAPAGERRRARPRSTRRARRPTLEAQLVDFVDEIAYNNHDIDDGLTSGMFTVEQIRAVRALPRGPRRGAGARASRTSASCATRSCGASSTAARSDLLETTPGEPAARRGVESRRGRAPGRAGGSSRYSPDMARRVRS